MWLFRDFGGAYGGLIAMIVIFIHNFMKRKDITGLIFDLSHADANFAGRVKKENLGIKFGFFIGSVAILWGGDYYANCYIRPKIDLYIFLGYAFPIFCQICSAFLYTEILKFTRNVFMEINTSITGLLRSSFEKQSLIRFVKLHYQLLGVSYKEARIFGVPFLALLVHFFFLYTIMYGTTVKMMWEGTLYSKIGSLEFFGYNKWCWFLVGTWWYIIRSWDQIAEEVSHKSLYWKEYDFFLAKSSKKHLRNIRNNYIS